MMLSILSRVIGVVVLVVLGYLVYKSGGFNAANFGKIIQGVDSRGGNILILFLLTIIFFAAAMGFAYHAMGMIEAKTLTPDNTMAVMIIQFVTGGAFGTVMGALIQLLGGSSSKHDSNP